MKKQKKEKKSKKILIISMFALIAVILDQLSKYLIKTNLKISESIPIIKNIFHLTFVTNTGSAFGMFKGFQLPLIIISILAIIFILYYQKEIKEKDFSLQIFTGLLLGGIIGNLIDRIIYSHVIDFIEIGYVPVYTWPVFNIADSFLTISAIYLGFYFIKKESKSSSRHKL